MTGSPCVNISAPYVPSNVTTDSDLPGNALPKIAIAPWTTPECVQAYLSMGRADLVQSFFFFLPGEGNAAPPPSTDAAWNLGDNGEWKSDNGYPVYAISSTIGAILMQQLSEYSGNVSTAPNSNFISSTYGTKGMARLAITVDLTTTSSLPSLWIFLVIILAVLVALVGLISLIMHLVQRRRRTQLRARVANGEVDLESLGIKRLLVPQEVLNKMPLYTYEQPTGVTTILESGSTPPSTKGPTSTIAAAPLPSATNHFQQPTCAICLDDFVAGQSQVRELPCNHIYHPECVDNFLTENSSLCPLCKTTALPAGYCPTAITAAMVRRERAARRARERAERRGPAANGTAAPEEHRLSDLMLRRHSRGQPMNPRHDAARPPTEGNAAAPADAPATTPQGQDRSEWIRQRIDDIVQQTDAPPDPEREEQQQPIWRRAFRRVFPHA